MNKISDFIIKKSTKKLLLISTIIIVFFMAVILPKVSIYTEEVTGTSNSPDTNLIYSSDDLFDIAETYGEEGRDVYILLRFTFDVIWPIVYFVFLASLMGFLIQKLSIKSKHKYLILLPVFSIIFDYLENITSVIVMYKYPTKVLFFASVAPAMTMLKWILLGVSFITIIVLLVKLMIDKYYKRIS